MTKEKKEKELYCIAKRTDKGRSLYSSEWLIVNKYADLFPEDGEYKQETEMKNQKLSLQDCWTPVAYEELVDWNLEETKGELK